MAVHQYTNVVVKGIAAVVPTTQWAITEKDFLSEAEFKLSTKTTGILNRRIIPSNKTISDLTVTAAKQLLQQINWKADEVDLLINVTQSPDYILPATSCVLQGRLNLRTDTMCFDVNLGCSGFVYGLQMIHQFLSFGPYKKALLFCGDKSSLMLRKENKASYFLFGDAGAITAVEKVNNPFSSFFELYTNGKKYESILIKEGATRSAANQVKYNTEQTYGIYNLILNGADVFSFSTGEVAKSIDHFINELNINKQASSFIFHQANKLILETMRKKLGVSEENFYYSLEQFGNTSSASIPLTLVVNKDKLKYKQSVLLSGFGVGLSWGNALLNLSNCTFLNLIENDGE